MQTRKHLERKNIYAGQRVGNSVYVVYTDGSVWDVTSNSSLQVTSSDNTTVSTSDSGFLLAVKPGTAKVTGTYQQLSGTAEITVSSSSLSSFSVNCPTLPYLSKTLSVNCMALGTFSDGGVVDLTSASTWAVTDSSVLSVSNTSGTAGLLTGVGTGTATVSAAITSNGATSINAASVTVTNSSVTSVRVVPSTSTLVIGATKNFRALAVFADGTTADVTNQATWSSSNADAATVDNSNSKGLARALGTGTTSLSATFKLTTGNSTITVGESVSSIECTSTKITVPQGLSYQLKVTASDAAGNTSDVTSIVSYKSMLPEKAWVTPGGLLVVASDAYDAGFDDFTVKATYHGLTSRCTINLSNSTLSSISVSPPPSISVLDQYSSTAKARLSDGTSFDITSAASWLSTNVLVASVNNTDSKGVTTGFSVGTGSLAVYYEGLRKQSSSFSVTANPSISLQSITLSPANYTLPKGLTQVYTATGHYADGSTLDLTSTVVWASSSASVASISAGGTASGVKLGSTTITATLGATSGSTPLTVGAPSLVSIAVSPSSASVAKGLNKSFSATGTYSDGSTADITTSVTWSSGTTSVATIGAGTGIASGAGIGSSTITATSGAISGSGTLTVTAPTLVSIAVTPTNPSVAKGFNRQFTATGIYTDASSQDLTTSVTWSSGSTGVATIGAASGLASAIGAGSSTITATSGAISGNTTMTVTLATLSSIAVTPTNPSVAKGLTQQFTATGTYTDGSTADLTATVTWTSGTPAKATINSSGLATTVAVGTSVITATSGSISGNTTLTVAAAALTSIAVTPTNPSVAKGLTEQFTATGTYTDGSTADITSSVTWSSGTTAKATINSSGLATTVAVGSSVITAASGAISGNTTLTVAAAALTSIAVTPTNPSVAKGLTKQFTATGTYTDGSTADLTSTATWSSGTAAKATINASTGLATTVAVGTSVITATSGSISGNTTLTIAAAALVSIAVTPAGTSITAGSTQQYTATGTYTDASTANITSSVTWASSATSYATISSGGLATGVAAGSTTISATSGSISGSTTLTVTSGGGGGGGCFTGDTLILMADGTEKPISEVQVGDVVMSFSGVDDELVPNLVTYTYVKRNTIINIDGLRVTSEHRILRADGNYAPANEFKVGDELILFDGTRHIIENISTEDAQIYNVYNFTVDNNHTYIAGGIRVHNVSSF